MQARSEVDVLPTGQVRREAPGDLDQGSYRSIDPDLALIRDQNTRYDLQQRGLTLAVPPHHADSFTWAHIERHVAKRPEDVVAVSFTVVRSEERRVGKECRGRGAAEK